MEILQVRHAGHSGDIVYSLALSKYLAQKNNCKIDFYVVSDVKAQLAKGMIHPNGEFIMNEKSFNFIKPLLEAQSYINKVFFVKTAELPKNIFELDFYRKSLGINLAAGNIVDFPRKVLGFQIDSINPWLNLDKETINKDEFIICAFTRRYRNSSIDYSFLDSIKYVFFIGLEDEYLHFCQLHKLKNVKRVEISNALEMAQIINKARFFLGNQSFAFSIAESLKVERALEVCEICPNVIPSGQGASDYINNIALARILSEKKISTINNPKYINPNYTLYLN